MNYIVIIGIIILWIVFYKLIGKFNSSSKVISIGGSTVATFILVAIVVVVMDEDKPVYKEDVSLNEVVQILEKKYGFVENEEVKKVSYENQLRLRELSFKNEKCEYVVTISAKDNRLELSGAVVSSTDEEVLDCMTKNKEILARYFVVLTNFKKDFSEKGLITLISASIENTKKKDESTQIVNVDEFEFVIDHIPGKTTWLGGVPLPDYLKN